MSRTLFGASGVRNSGAHNGAVPLPLYAVNAEKLDMETPHAKTRPSVLTVKGPTPPAPKMNNNSGLREMKVCPSMKPERGIRNDVPTLLNPSFPQL
jgi:hypothetical protein